MTLLAAARAVDATSWPLLAVSLLGAYLLSTLVYRVLFHPLRKVPGPFIAKCTSLWLNYHQWAGDEATRTMELHRRHGSIVRIAPNHIDIDDGEALGPVYSSKGGFLKADCYLNFDIEGHNTIFSATDPEHRRLRSKAVVNMFATAAVHAKGGQLRKLSNQFVERLSREGATKEPVNLLNLTRSLAVDVVSTFLFEKSYNALVESNEKMSASKFVDAFVAVGRFFYLPKRLFVFLESAVARLQPNHEALQSAVRVDQFVQELVDSAQPGKDDTYQSRLLDAGISKHEAKAQCEDLMFAGTDSSGMNLASICWHLVGNPKVYERLRQEIQANPVPIERLQTLPYLRAVVNEGLRISWANPVQLPRVVPAAGWEFKGYYFPAGTLVGLGSYQLHLNEDVFKDGRAFKPDRWLNPTAEMQRDFIPFSQGPRQCIARNLALAELFVAVDSIVRADVLRGARRVNDSIEILEWFNSRVPTESIPLVWV